MSVKRFCAVVALVGMAVGAAGRAEAGHVTLDFEGIATGADVGAYYQAEGAMFTGATILTAPNYNYTGYPPHSGVNVIYSQSTGIIEVDATPGTTFADVSLYYTANGGNGLFLDSYDIGGNLIDSVHGPDNYTTNSLLASTATGVAYVRIHDSGNFFTVDDFSFNTASVPEPSSVVLCGMAALTCLGYGRRRKKSA